MPAGGGVAGQPVSAYLVGRRRFVLVDPGDPTGPGLDRALALAAERGGPIEAVALTHVDPDHAAGAEAVAERLGIPVLTGPGGGRPLPYDVREVADLDPLEAGDVAVRPIRTPGPRPDHLAFVVGDGRFVLAGDLDGVRGARSITAPPDEAAWAASRERLARLAPAATRLAGHPTPDTPGLTSPPSRRDPARMHDDTEDDDAFEEDGRAGGACPTRSPDRGPPRSSSSSPWASRPGTCGSSRCSPGRRAPTSSSTSCSSCRRSARSSCRPPSSPATRTRRAGPGPCSPGRSCSPSSRAWSCWPTRCRSSSRPSRHRAPTWAVSCRCKRSTAR